MSGGKIHARRNAIRMSIEETEHCNNVTETTGHTSPLTSARRSLQEIHTIEIHGADTSDYGKRRNSSVVDRSLSDGSLVLPSRKRSFDFTKNDQPLKVIVDVDAGVDDAMALILLLAADGIKLIQIMGITCTHGNTSVNNVCTNVLRLLGTAGRFDIPVYQGAEEPLILRETKCPIEFEHFHGLDGFGDLNFPHKPSMRMLQPENAVSALNNITSQHKEKVSLVCLAPLTNIALAMKTYSQFTSNLKDIFIMGGNSTGMGNITSAGEFNFYSDPEAAHIVLTRARCPIFLLPWETCLNTDISLDWRFNTLGAVRNTHMDLINAIEKKVWENSNFTSWLPCDAIIAAVLLRADIIKKSRKCHVTVELHGSHTRGQVVLDHLQMKDPNVTLIEEVDSSLLKKLLLWAAGYPDSSFE